MSDTENTPAAPGDDSEVRSRTRTRARRAPRAAATDAAADVGSPAAEAADDQGDTAAAQAAEAPDTAATAEPDGGADPVRRKVRARRPKADAPAAPDVEDAAQGPAGDEAGTPAADAGDPTDEAPQADEEDPPAPTRRRRSRRTASSRAPAADPADVPVDAADEPSGEVTAVGDEATDEDASDDDAGEDAGTADTSVAGDGAVVAAEDADPDGEVAETGAEGEGERPAGARRRRRGGRGRGRRGGRGRARPDGEAADDATSTETDAAADDVDSDDSGADDDAPTRLQARAKSGRAGGARTAKSRNRAGGGGTGRGGRRPLGGVSEETRRAINEGPPRRMLVTVGESRTQVAVLEERTLVEHYVTRKEEVSYVGNIYMGRVQNVLPGMEAAFVDIGKGRNGVLYAGEVNYDEADLDGDLPRIEQTLKSGQTLLVQVTKDPMGTKGARLTQHLSVAGRYCVLAKGDDMLGISRKLTDEERERLRKILKGLKPEGYGLIVRTAAEGATREQLEADIARLVRIWDEVNANAEGVKALEPVYEEPHLVMRVIRDVFGSEYSELIVDSELLAQQIRDYLSDVSPDFVDRVKVHSGEEHIFDAYEVTNQIRRALEKKVWLKSGGYLIVEKTEAMWVIDVNTGKFVGERNLEETVLRNNLEAADEIARQLRLRDMGGIIVIDFVDMLVPANRDEVLKRFRRELARDKTKSRVMEISKLGLVQMTRKNVSQGLQESFTEPCPTCDGRGAKIVDHMLH